MAGNDSGRARSPGPPALDVSSGRRRLFVDSGSDPQWPSRGQDSVGGSPYGTTPACAARAAGRTTRMRITATMAKIAGRSTAVATVAVIASSTHETRDVLVVLRLDLHRDNLPSNAPATPAP